MISTIDISAKQIEISFFKDLNSTEPVTSIIIGFSKLKKYPIALRHIIESLKEYNLDSIIISYPGEVNPVTGVFIDSYLYEFWNGMNLKSDLEKEFNIPVVVENDAVIFGSSVLNKNEDVLNIMFGYNSGIGGSIYKFRNNKFESVPFEIGHTIVVMDGELCHCGQRGCLESYASVRAIKEMFGQLPASEDEERLIVVARYIVQTIMSVLAVTNIKTINFGGGSTIHSKEYISNVVKYTEKILKRKNKWLNQPNFVITDFQKRPFESIMLEYLKNSDKIINLNYQ